MYNNPKHLIFALAFAGCASPVAVQLPVVAPTRIAVEDPTPMFGDCTPSMRYYQESAPARREGFVAPLCARTVVYPAFVAALNKITTDIDPDGYERTYAYDMEYLVGEASEFRAYRDAARAADEDHNGVIDDGAEAESLASKLRSMQPLRGPNSDGAIDASQRRW